MIKWERQPLYFAVIDGDDPRNWKPWKKDKTFASMYDDCQKLISAVPMKEDEPQASFEPIAEPLEAVLKSKRLHGIVGAIIDATEPPDELNFYEAKMEGLERLCKTMRLTEDFENLLIKKTINWFEVWFFISSPEIEAWSRWATRSRDIVNRCFKEQPLIKWVPDGALFPFQARCFLNDSKDSMLWGKR